VGVPPFVPEQIELELAAHRDGGFYRTHIDTHTGPAQEGDGRDRMLTMVYYFHRTPRAFSGGEIALYPFVPGGDPVLIEPADNRLVAFPSLALHEVRPVACPGDDWADARFAVNIWFARQRTA
jgi:SM-20-related protein